MIEEKIKSIKERIVVACGHSNIEPAGITVVGVTKMVNVKNIEAALKAGIKNIGESRIQEASAKFPLIELSGIRKHLIGHLQTNKVKKAVELFDVIQSLDRTELAREIDRHAKSLGKVQECLIEVKVSPEETKFGLAPEDAEGFISSVALLKNIKVNGIMAMAPYFDDTELARPYFKKAKQIFDSLRSRAGISVLSMGMSGDFEVAIEEGANMVRIGTAIFK